MSEDGYVVCGVDELTPGERVLVQIEGREIVVFHLGNAYVAYLNWCAHQGGPCGEGTRTGTRVAQYDRESGTVSETWEREGEIINCPWHGWEYDLRTGECLSRRDRSLPAYPVKVEGDQLVVYPTAQPSGDPAASEG